VKFGQDYDSRFGFTINQLIFDGSYIVGLQASRTYQELSVNSKKKTDEEIKYAVAQAYYTVLVAAENQKIVEQSYQSIETLLNETKAIFEEGYAIGIKDYFVEVERYDFEPIVSVQKSYDFLAQASYVK